MKFHDTTTPATDTKGRYIKRPLVEIELLGNGKTITALGLIDSGADITMLNLEYAEELGINLEHAGRRPFLGIGAQRIACYVSTVTFRVKRIGVSMVTAAAFIESPSVDVLLGQEDFFARFRVKFEKDHDTFELTLSPKAPRRM